MWAGLIVAFLALQEGCTLVMGTCWVGSNATAGITLESTSLVLSIITACLSGPRYDPHRKTDIKQGSG